MSYYYRGNLAVEQEQSHPSVVKKRRTIVVKSAIPTGEKMLYLLMICMVITGVVFVGLRYMEISEYNYLIQNTKAEIAQMEEENAALQLEIDQMSSHERIRVEAEEMGMMPAEIVRVVGGHQNGRMASGSNAN